MQGGGWVGGGGTCRVCVSASLAAGVVSAEDLVEFKGLFAGLDASDASGSLTVEEIHRFRKKLGIRTNSLIDLEDWVALVDDKGDGEIQLDEFCVLMHIARRGGDLAGMRWAAGRGPKAVFDFASASVRQIVWFSLEDPSSSFVAGLVSFVMMSLIFVSVTAFCAETVRPVMEVEGMEQAFGIVEVVCVGVFSLEYLLRLACTPAPARFVFGFLNLVDLVAILPFFVDLALADNAGDAGGADSESGAEAGEESNTSRALRVVRLTRVARIFKLSRYLGWLRLYYNALRKALFPLTMAFAVTMVSTLLFASFIFYAEKGDFDPGVGLYVDADGQPSTFQSIFDGIYWSIITITTVGYGDVTPQSTVGRLVGMVSLIVGLFVLAIPISIFSMHFQHEYSELLQVQRRGLQRRREHRVADQANANANTNANANANANTKLTAREKKKRRISSVHPAKLATKDAEKLPPMLALSRALELIEASGLASLEARSELRQRALQQQMQRVVDANREMLWVKLRVLERSFREDILRSTLDRYSAWFIKSDEETEQDIVDAVQRLQAVFRGRMARLVLSTKLVAWKTRTAGSAGSAGSAAAKGPAVEVIEGLGPNPSEPLPGAL